MAAKRKSKSRSKKRTTRKTTRRKTTTRKTTRKSTRRKSTSKTKKSKGKRVPFGGYSIGFAGRTETLEQVFGKKRVVPSLMTKLIWKFIKAHKLGSS